MEKACFERGSDTLLLMLAEPQAEAYRRSYDTEQERMIILPPTLDKNLIPQDLDASERATLRTKLGYHPDEIIWLWLGLHPKPRVSTGRWKPLRSVRQRGWSPAAPIRKAGRFRISENRRKPSDAVTD
nr:hypothetical protein [Georhizobium profundi]